MRTVDPGLLAAMESGQSTYCHLYEFYRRGTVPGSVSLVRITEGLVDDVPTSGLSDLADFTVVDGTWALSGGKIENTAGDPGVLRYDNITDVDGKVIQVLADHRSAGEPFWGACSKIDAGGSPVTSDLWVLEKRVTDTGSTSPPGTENQDGVLFYNGTGAYTGDADLSQHQDHPVILGHNGPRTGNMEGYVYRSSNGPLGFGFVQGSSDPEAANHCGLWVKRTSYGPQYWSYSGTIYFTRLSVYTDYVVLIIGLSPGMTGEIKTGASPTYGTDTDGNTASSGNPTSTIDPTGDMYPFTTIRVKQGTGVIATATPADGVWGGDVWELQQSSTFVETPVLNVTDASGDVLYNGRTFEAIGGEIAWQGGGVGEGDDTRSQGVTLEFPNVDESKVFDLLKAGAHRNLRCRVWRAHYDEDAGQRVGEPLCIHDGVALTGYQVSEESGVDEDGKPTDATSRLTVRIATQLATVERRGGLTTNPNVIGRVFSGDTWGSTVPGNMGRRINWPPL